MKKFIEHNTENNGLNAQKTQGTWTMTLKTIEVEYSRYIVEIEYIKKN